MANKEVEVEQKKGLMKNQPATEGTDERTVSQKPTHEQIAAKAYDLYVQHGRQEGRSEEYWLRAEQWLMERYLRSTTEASIPNQPHEIHPVDSRPQPYARDERGSASREEIRRETSAMRPPSRQSLRPPERSRQAR